MEGGKGGNACPPIHEGQGEPSVGGERAPSVRLKPLRALSVRKLLAFNAAYTRSVARVSAALIKR